MASPRRLPHRRPRAEFWESPGRATVRIATSLVAPRLAPGWTPTPHVGGRGIAFRVRADLATPLGLRLYRYGHWDDDLDLVVSRLRPGDVFVDGGANVGLFTLAAAAAVGPEGTVISFEPAPRTADELERNVSLNGAGHVSVRRQALAAAEGSATLVAFEGLGHGLSSFAPSDPAGGRPVQVPVTTLDAAVGRRPVRLVKLDLEGAEVAALAGASTLLRHQRPEFLVEVEDAHLRRQGSSAQDLFAVFARYGYQPRPHGRGHEGPNVWFVPARPPRDG